MTVAESLSDDQLIHALELIQEADSVELKLTVSAAERWSTINALGIDPLDAQIREVYFFDTPDLALDRAGVVVRARRVQGKGDDSVIKLRPVNPENLPPELRMSEDFVVEVDAMPGGYVCSGSLKAKLGPGKVRPIISGGRSKKKLFSKAQRAFYAAHAPEGIALDDLATLGPIIVLKVKFAPVDYDRSVAVEMWSYPDGSRILELSTRCGIHEPFQVAAEAKAYLASKGISISSEQQTKTRAALVYYSETLAAESPAAESPPEAMPEDEAGP